MIIVSIITTAVQMTEPSVSGMIILFILYGVFTFGMITFIDALSSLYFHQGKKIHYPIARYVGSLSYAVFALFAGYLASAKAILTSQVIFYIIILLILVLKIDKAYGVVDIKPVQTNSEKSFFKVLRAYPMFLFLLLATCSSFIGKEMVANFLIDVYRGVGGTSKDYGLGISLLAFSEVPIIFAFEKILVRLGIEKLMIMSFLFAAIRIFIIMIAPSVFWLNFAQIFQFLGTGLFWAGNVQFVRTILPAEYFVKAQSAIGICYLGIGSGVGSLLSGTILEYTNLFNLLAVSFLFSFLGVVFMVIGKYITKKV